jgi:diguanylate cyclase (GGDEF)-like protein
MDAASGHLRLQTSLNDLAEHHMPFCVLMAEVDELVNFQQAHGKEAVQAAQAVVGRTLSNALRPTDVVVRWDECRFLTIVKNCEQSVLRSVAERVRKMESYSAVEWWGDELQVTVSIGGTAAMQGDSVDDLLERAQRALRLSMQEGGNRVSIFSQTETRSFKG